MTLLLPQPDLVVRGIEITLVVAGAARWSGAVSTSGFLAGMGIGLGVSLSLGSPGLLVVGAFFLLGTLATRWRYDEKHRRGMAEPDGGARGAGRVLAKGAVGAALAVAGVFDFFDSHLTRAAFAGAFAAAVADTLGTEIGQVLGRRAFTVIPPAAAKPGTPGAVSVAGSVAGFLGALLVAAAGFAAGVLAPADLPLVAAAGLLGSLVEAALSPLLRGSPWRGLAANLLTTASGAAIAAGFVALLRHAGGAP